MTFRWFQLATIRPLGLVLALTLTSGVVAESSDTTASKDLEQTVAVVNDEPLTRSDLLAHGKRRGYRNPEQLIADAATEKLWLFDLVDYELLRQAALRENLDSQSIRDDVKAFHRIRLVKVFVDKHFEENPITDEFLKAEYEKSVDRHEYKARHILVSDRETAQELIVQLEQGADFAKLAESHSKDTRSAKKGGDLDWFRREAMVATFSDAVIQMDVGTISKKPVQSRFGWHVIYLEDKRESEPPAFETARDKLYEKERRKRLEALIYSLKREAKVEY